MNSLKTIDSTTQSKEKINHMRWPSIQAGGHPGLVINNSSAGSKVTDMEYYNVLLQNVKTPTEKEIELENNKQIPYKFKTRAGRYASG